jgi:hypothetical protein
LRERVALERQVSNERSLELMKQRRRSLVGKPKDVGGVHVAPSGVAEEEWAEEGSAPSASKQGASSSTGSLSKESKESTKSEKHKKKQKAPMLTDSYDPPKILRGAVRVSSDVA